MIAELHKAGVEKVIMLSGDNEGTATRSLKKLASMRSEPKYFLLTKWLQSKNWSNNSVRWP